MAQRMLVVFFFRQEGPGLVVFLGIFGCLSILNFLWLDMVRVRSNLFGVPLLDDLLFVPFGFFLGYGNQWCSCLMILICFPPSWLMRSWPYDRCFLEAFEDIKTTSENTCGCRVLVFEVPSGFFGLQGCITPSNTWSCRSRQAG